MINRDNDQLIKPIELFQFAQIGGLNDVSLVEIEEMINEYDTSGSGCLRFDEFVQMFMPAGVNEMQLTSYGQMPSGLAV